MHVVRWYQQPLMIRLAVHLGAGKHINQISPDQFSRMSMVIFVTEFFSPLPIACAKASILFFYWRIFSQASSGIRVAVYTLAFVLSAWTLITVNISFKFKTFINF